MHVSVAEHCGCVRKFIALLMAELIGTHVCLKRAQSPSAEMSLYTSTSTDIHEIHKNHMKCKHRM